MLELCQKLETLRHDNEVHKESIQAKITLLKDQCRLKDTEVKLLDDELMVKKQAAKEQDMEVWHELFRKSDTINLRLFYLKVT